MKDPVILNRREFTLQAALAVLGGSTITILGCGGYKSPSGPSGPTDVVGAISANHGHVAVITGAEMVAGSSVQLNIQGSAPHNHVVALSAEEIATLRRGGAVTRTSSVGDGHDHSVAFQGPAAGTGGYGGG